MAAYRYAAAAFFGELSQEKRDDATAGQRMMYEVPEVRDLLYSEYVRLIDLIAEALVRRGHDPADVSGRRVVAGAIVGVLIAASHNTPLPEDALLRSLSILEDKLS